MENSKTHRFKHKKVKNNDSNLGERDIVHILATAAPKFNNGAANVIGVHNVLENSMKYGENPILPSEGEPHTLTL